MEVPLSSKLGRKTLPADIWRFNILPKLTNRGDSASARLACKGWRDVILAAVTKLEVVASCAPLPKNEREDSSLAGKAAADEKCLKFVAAASSLMNLKITELTHSIPSPSLSVLGTLQFLKTLTLAGEIAHYLGPNPKFYQQPLPRAFANLHKLEALHLKYMYSVGSIDVVCNITTLQHLSVMECGCADIPEGIAALEGLRTLKFSLRDELLGIPGVMEYEDVTIPDSIGQLTNLVELVLSGLVARTRLPDSLTDLRSLEVLDVTNCFGLFSLPAGICRMPRLRKIVVTKTRVSEQRKREIMLAMPGVDVIPNTLVLDYLMLEVEQDDNSSDDEADGDENSDGDDNDDNDDDSDSAGDDDGDAGNVGDDNENDAD